MLAAAEVLPMYAAWRCQLSFRTVGQLAVRLIVIMAGMLLVHHGYVGGKYAMICHWLT